MKKSILKLKLRRILLEEDPVGIYFPEDNNRDEYDSEIEMIVDSLGQCHNRHELLDRIWNIFDTEFNAYVAGQKERYTVITNRIWELVKEKRLNKPEWH